MKLIGGNSKNGDVVCVCVCLYAFYVCVRLVDVLLLDVIFSAFACPRTTTLSLSLGRVRSFVLSFSRFFPSYILLRLLLLLLLLEHDDDDDDDDDGNTHSRKKSI